MRRKKHSHSLDIAFLRQHGYSRRGGDHSRHPQADVTSIELIPPSNKRHHPRNVRYPYRKIVWGFDGCIFFLVHAFLLHLTLLRYGSPEYPMNSDPIGYRRTHQAPQATNFDDCLKRGKSSNGCWFTCAERYEVCDVHSCSGRINLAKLHYRQDLF